MEAREDIYELTDRYLAHTLSDSEREAFEQRCESDSEFAAEVKIQLKARYFERSTARDAFKNRIREHLETKAQEKPIRKISASYYWAAAAVIVLFVGGWWWQYMRPLSLQQVYSHYYDTPSMISRNAFDGPNWEQAMALYEEGNYEEAIRALEYLLRNSAFEQAAEARLFMGICYMEQAHFKEALHSFDQIPEASALREEALWYTAFAYIKLKDRAKAVASLERIGTLGRSHDMEKKAAEVLKKLKR